MISTKIVSLTLGQRNYLRFFFFYDSDMISIWFCYGFDMVDFMVFLWLKSALLNTYDSQYGFGMV